MTGTISSNRQAKANGRLGEQDAKAEGYPVRVGSADLLDGPNIDTKVAVPLVRQCPTGTPEDQRDACPTRAGRFRFERKQHEKLLEMDGTYHLRLRVGDRTIPLCDIKARSIDRAFGRRSEGLTIPWPMACQSASTEPDTPP